MLESVDYEAFELDAAQHLVVINVNLFKRLQAFDFRKQDERVEVVVR